MYKIEEGIKCVSPKSGKGRPSKYPWREMRIGDSFFIPNKDVTSDSMAFSAPSNFSLRNPEYKFAVRRIEDGYRIWRIAVKKETT